MSFVVIDKLWVRYGRFVAVRGVSISIDKGEVYGFIGPNGAGKSSTMKVLATLLTPSGGTASIGGTDVTIDPQSIRRRIGYVPDYFGVYDDLTANEYLHFFAAAYRIDSRTRQSVVDDVLALTDLAHKRDSQVNALSRGMKQRLSLARVLLHDPEFLILDEPASGLDPRARIEIRELLKELKNMGKTIMISSHILHELGHLCTAIGIIEAGKMVAEGNLNDIYRQLELKRTVHAQITNIDDALFARMQQIPGVAAVERSPDRLAFQLRQDELAIEDLLDHLHGLGARIHMFQPEAMDMETAFMKLTEGRTA